MGIDLSIIWFVIIVFATLMYIVMDGFDLGDRHSVPGNAERRRSRRNGQQRRAGLGRK